MDLVTLVIGIALGAAFSPFWLKVYTWAKDKIQGTTTTTTTTVTPTPPPAA